MIQPPNRRTAGSPDRRNSKANLSPVQAILLIDPVSHDSIVCCVFRSNGNDAHTWAEFSHRNGLRVDQADEAQQVSLVRAIATSLLAKSNSVTHSKTVPSSSTQVVVTYIRENLSHKLSPSCLARISRVSGARLNAKFRQELGISVKRFILGERIQRAKQMLSRGDPAKKVSLELGFRTLAHFSQTFKKHAGVSPRSFALFYTSDHRYFTTETVTTV